MKKILLLLGVFIVTIASAIAYTPSASLEAKLETVVEKLEGIIDTRGEAYRDTVLSAISSYQSRYSDDERVSYIFSYLYEELHGHSHASSSVISDYTGSYTIDSSTYGTQVEVVVDGDTRTITSNALPNHETGVFPNEANPNTISAQDRNWELTTDPEYVGAAAWARENGVAYNGIKFELETAERVNCESGEQYRVEAQQTVIDVIGLDHNHAHVQPTGEYHYHGVPTEALADIEGDDIIHVGYASDGFPIYYSRQGSYTPSYQLVSDLRE